jgi:hypothetical protein
MPPESIFMVGMDAADGASEQGVAEFNEYYSSTHVPEVLENGKYHAGTRFELLEAFMHRRPDTAPRFCAVYEGDTAASAGPPPGPPTPGPASWEKRDTKWRLRYRRVGDLVTAPGASA